jgi:HK97 family phage portal protein
MKRRFGGLILDFVSHVASFFAATSRSVTTASNDGWESLLGGLGGGRSFTGSFVDEQAALKVTAVYRAIALISEGVAMLPVDVMQRVGDRREERPEHPVAGLLRRPNPLMTAADLKGTLQAHALQYGNAYIDVQRKENGAPVHLWPLLPDRTRAMALNDSGGDRSIYYRTIVGGEVVGVNPSDVAHIHGLAFDGLRGYSPLYLAREAVGLALGLEEFGGRFFGNDSKSGGFLEHPGKLSAEAQQRLREQMDAQGGLTNAHRTKILEEGMTFRPTTIAPEDAQFLMTRTFQVEEIARLYGVPLHMLQSQSKTTSWGSGIAQMSLGFVIYSVAPWLVRWEQELERKLMTPEEIAEGFYLRHNLNALLRADALTRARFYTAALNRATGWMRRNEVRALEDLNPDDVVNEAPTSPFDSGGDDQGDDDGNENADE